MPKDFSLYLNIILKHEGGYVDHPDDPGGATNMGITKAVYEDWVGHRVSKDDIKALKEEDVRPIYRANYWNRVRGDELPLGLDLCVFDFGVNAGTGRAARKLQGIIGSSVDGAIGPMTLAAVGTYIEREGGGKLIETFQDVRAEHYKSLSHFEQFGRGWIRRTEETTALALEMIS